MAINKVVYGSNTLIDLTDTTAAAGDVAAGKYFYAANGVKTLGTAEGSSGGAIYQDQDGYLVLAEESDGITVDDIASKTKPSGAITLSVSEIGSYAFAAKPITSVVGNSVTDIKNSAFYYCSSLQTVSFPNLVAITGTYCFRGCSDLRVVHLPELTTMPSNNYMFYQLQSKLANAKAVIVLPKVTSISRSFDRVFADKVDLGPSMSSLTSCAFYNNVAGAVVNTVILRKSDGIVTAGNTDAIKGLSNVYVPRALVSTYTTASNWSTLIAAGTITLHEIEGSIYENAYADGTPISSV